MAATSTTTSTGTKVSVKTEIRVYAHSNLIYWWPVWLWGYCCAGLTYVAGIGVPELAASSEKVILFHPRPWVGLSFVLLTVAVIAISNLRARGVHSVLVLIVLTIVFWQLPRVPGMQWVLSWLPLLRVHLNLAFYVTFSTLVLVLWAGSIALEHLAWYRFAPGQMAEEHRFTHATGRAFTTDGMLVRRLPDDLFRHKILGCQWLGLGTGDMIVVAANKETFELHNVVRANARQKLIQDLVAMRSTV